MAMTDPAILRDLDDPKLEALIEMMFLAAYADGEFSDEEREHFQNSVESLTDERMQSERFKDFLKGVEKSLEEEGREARLKQVKDRLTDPGARRVALALAIQVCAADGIIRTSERELILETAESLDIDAGVAADLVRDTEQSMKTE